MTPEFDEVLLTAYLDDEVTDAERACVEEQLRQSESARKLLQELRTIRNRVTQLAQLQPSRNLKSGPWSSPTESRTVELSPQVPDSTTASNWKVVYQKLASLAAVIAIVACSMILLRGPNSKQIGQVELADRTKNDDEFAGRKEESAPEESMQTEALQRQVIEIDRGGEDPIATGSVSREFGETASNAKAGSSLRLESQMKADVAANGPAASGGFGGRVPAPSDMSAEKPMRVENRKMADPSAAVPPPDKPPNKRLLAESLAEDQPDESLTRFVESYLQERDIAKANANPIQDFLLAESLSDSDARQLNKDNAVPLFAWRFQNANSVASEIELKTHDKMSVAPRTFEKSKAVSSPTMIVEFQIPSEDWTAGAKRLRQLGVNVPMELPVEDVLEFSAQRKVASAAAPVIASTPQSPVLDGPVSLEAAPSIAAESKQVSLERFSFLPAAPASIADNVSDSKRAAKKERRVVKVQVRVN